MWSDYIEICLVIPKMKPNVFLELLVEAMKHLEKIKPKLRHRKKTKIAHENNTLGCCLSYTLDTNNNLNLYIYNVYMSNTFQLHSDTANNLSEDKVQ